VGRLRIVGGAFRGRYVKVPQGSMVRPTAEMVREALFNVLGELQGCVVMDLFAGSGALGLEAISRGAVWCTFVERDRRVASVLRENLVALGVQEVSEVFVANYTAGLGLVTRKGRRYDVMFVDPPYEITGEVVECIRPWLTRLVKGGGLVVVEARKGQTFDPGLTEGLEEVFSRSYGDTSLCIVRRGEEDR